MYESLAFTVVYVFQWLKEKHLLFKKTVDSNLYSKMESLEGVQYLLLFLLVSFLLLCQNT